MIETFFLVTVGALSLRPCVASFSINVQACCAAHEVVKDKPARPDERPRNVQTLRHITLLQRGEEQLATRVVLRGIGGQHGK